MQGNENEIKKERKRWQKVNKKKRGKNGYDYDYVVKLDLSNG